MADYVHVYDTTLRDGTQGEGVSFSKVDKVRIAQMLDSFGVSYIEGGWPGSNPKDMGFFNEARTVEFETAKLTAFGSTRRANLAVADDPQIKALLDAETPVVTIFGKTWLLHVTDVLRIEPATNLEMIADSCAYLRDQGREVVYDAEHFFDGYKMDNDYALETLVKAAEAGAGTVVLCDTNGGSLPEEVAAATEHAIAALPKGIVVGIHPHNDSGLAVANALAAIRVGARHVQGTINGIGERCGNVDLCSVIPNLELKMGLPCLPAGQLSHLKETSTFVYELANLKPDNKLPFVGDSAFAHKGGIHVNAVEKCETSYEHIRPELVGNKRRILISDLSGGSNILARAAEHDIELDPKAPEVRQILGELKNLESEGYEFEAAGASFELLMKKILEGDTSGFELDGFRVIVEKRGHDAPCLSEATVKVKVGNEFEISAAEGDGPVNALDLALRRALSRFYPQLTDVRLRDYKVRILDGDDGTKAKTRVLIESSDGHENWGTVGVSENIIQASWQALVDAMEYAIYVKKQTP